MVTPCKPLKAPDTLVFVWVKYAMLGLVIERPGYGRDLAQRFRERLGSWDLESSAIHAALDQLEREGSIRSTGATAHAPRGAPRVVYEATQQGVARFDRWISAPASAPDLRDELHVRIATAQPQNLDRLIEITYEQERACLERLQAYAGRSSFGEVLARGGAWDAVAALIVRDAEVMHLEATMDWLARAREAMLWVRDRPQGAAPDWD
jgi:DNA-binding PadR family transcriptional regulator